MYSKWRKEKKYFDLCINIQDEKIFVHKSLICEQSEFVSMLHRRLTEASVTQWPPINTIFLDIPDNLKVEDIKSAIDFIYDKNVTDTLSAVLGLTYLLAPPDVMIDLVKKNLCKSLDDERSKDCVHYIIENYGSSMPYLLPFFGVDSDCVIPEELTVFGKEIKPLGENLSIPMESGMFYFKDEKRKESFEFAGVKWCIHKFTIGICSWDRETVYKIYVDNECEATEPVKIRATMYIFRLNGKQLMETNIETVIPQKFKVRIMAKEYSSNKLTFSCSEDDKTRVSLLMEKIY